MRIRIRNLTLELQMKVTVLLLKNLFIFQHRL
jgi:hypothetical protein